MEKPEGFILLIDIFNYMTYTEAFGISTKKQVILPLLAKLFQKSGKFSKVGNSNTNSFDQEF